MFSGNNDTDVGVHVSMDLSRLRMLLAAPVASLFVVLLLCELAVHRPQPAVGLRVPMVKLKKHSQGYMCEDDWPHVVRLAADGRMWFVRTEVAPDKLGPLIAKVNEGRHEHVLYLLVDPSVSYEQFADFLDKVQSSTSGLHVLLLSGQLRNYTGPVVVHIPPPDQTVFFPSCDFEWSENGFDAPSMNETDTESLR